MRLIWIKASYEYQKLICGMLDGWAASGEKIVPYATRAMDYRNLK